MQGYTIVFDLDGTLIDTAPDLIAATNRMLHLHGHDPCPSALISPEISHGARRMLVKAFGHHGRTFSDAEMDAIYERYIEHYSANIAANSRPYPGLIAVLDRLAAGGARLAVCTNKRESLALKLLTELGLVGRFAALAGWDTFKVMKPDPGHLTLTIARAGGDPRRAVMVGDSATDIRTAKAARIPVIGVSFGYTDLPVRELGADAVIDHYDELEPALARFLPGAR